MAQLGRAPGTGLGKGPAAGRDPAVVEASRVLRARGRSRAQEAHVAWVGAQGRARNRAQGSGSGAQGAERRAQSARCRPVLPGPAWEAAPGAGPSYHGPPPAPLGSRPVPVPAPGSCPAAPGAAGGQSPAGAMGPPEEARVRLARCGQSHLLRFWAELGPAQRGALLAALPPGLGEHCRLAAAAGARQRGPPERLDGRMEPLPARLLGSARRSGPAALERWEAEGERAAGPPLPAGGCGGRPGGGLGRQLPAGSPGPSCGSVPKAPRWS